MKNKSIYILVIDNKFVPKIFFSSGSIRSAKRDYLNMNTESKTYMYKINKDKFFKYLNNNARKYK